MHNVSWRSEDCLCPHHQPRRWKQSPNANCQSQTPFPHHWSHGQTAEQRRKNSLQSCNAVWLHSGTVARLLSFSDPVSMSSIVLYRSQLRPARSYAIPLNEKLSLYRPRRKFGIWESLTSSAIMNHLRTRRARASCSPYNSYTANVTSYTAVSDRYVRFFTGEVWAINHVLKAYAIILNRRYAHTDLSVDIYQNGTRLRTTWGVSRSTLYFTICTSHETYYRNWITVFPLIPSRFEPPCNPS